MRCNDPHTRNLLPRRSLPFPSCGGTADGKVGIVAVANRPLPVLYLYIGEASPSLQVHVMRNNDPKSEMPAIKEKAAKAKEKQARQIGTAKEREQGQSSRTIPKKR